MCPGRAEHILLDPLHLHHPQCLLEADWFRRGAPRRGQDPGPAGEEIPQVLSVGLLLPLLPGKTQSPDQPEVIKAFISLLIVYNDDTVSCPCLIIFVC